MNAATGPRRSDRPKERLGLRILSGLVLAPLVLAAVWWGTPYFEVLVGIFALVMCWEWTNLSRHRVTGAGPAVLFLTVMASIGLTAVNRPQDGLIAMAAGTAILAILAVPASRRGIGWLAGGAVYLALPCLALIWMRNGGVGLELVLGVMIAVWATDIGAYAAGRAFGGPKLAPSISPNKTWAGFVGGLAAAMAVGALTSQLVPVIGLAAALTLAAVIGVAAQLGDLWESWLKRHFKVKDSGAIIPGHGGILDRVDSLLAAVPVVAVIVLVTRGTGL